MTITPEDALEVCRSIRRDLTFAQGKLTDVMECLAAMPQQPLEDRTCPTCGVILRGPNALAEHEYNSHGAPVPEHILAAEALAEVPA